jgi:hypothetical protein
VPCDRFRGAKRSRRGVFANQQVLAAYSSPPERLGDYRLFDIAGVSIILVRNRDGGIQRPRHGRLRTARYMPDDLEQSRLGPRPCRVSVIESPVISASATRSALQKSSCRLRSR